MSERLRQSYDSDPLITAAARKAETILAAKEIRIEDFADLYGGDNIAKDKAYVEEHEAQFIEQGHDNANQTIQLAKVFEAVIHEMGSNPQAAWFGPNASMIRTSRFDDIKNGVDEVVEFKEPQKPASQLALAIDVTYSNDIRKKFDRIKGEIEKGELAQIKYFRSDKTGFRGEMTKIPRIVVGADVLVVKGVANLWIDNRAAMLATHPLQHQILEEARLQCEAFAKFAKKIGRIDEASRYEDSLHTIESIIAKKGRVPSDIGSEDRVFKQIKEFTENSIYWK